MANRSPFKVGKFKVTRLRIGLDQLAALVHIAVDIVA
jgi:hypothetical protein